jgi:peptidoglycan-associated lipoprotein
MVSRRWTGMVGCLLVLLVAFAGCAKRPATTQASAPAPAGVAGSTGPTSAPTGPSSGSGESGLQPGGGPGATAGARPEIKEFVAVPELKDIFFDFDKYDIRPSDARVLDANAAWLKSNATHLVLIEGHCDERGTNEYNLALGERRAKATMNYLVSQGVQASRITIISYGEERPVCKEHNEACWAKNRRAHFLVKPR